MNSVSTAEIIFDALRYVASTEGVYAWPMSNVPDPLRASVKYLRWSWSRAAHYQSISGGQHQAYVRQTGGSSARGQKLTGLMAHHYEPWLHDKTLKVYVMGLMLVQIGGNAKVSDGLAQIDDAHVGGWLLYGDDCFEHGGQAFDEELGLPAMICV